MTSKKHPHLRAVDQTPEAPIDITARARCSNDHEMTPENTYWHRDHALCRECRRANVRRHRAANGIFYGARDQRPFDERFWSKVDRRGPDECWPWTGHCLATGYGHSWRDGRYEQAHRVAWELANGVALGSRWCLHACDNPPCCNPAHLRPGDATDNMADASARRRFPNQHKARCPAGHEYSSENTYLISGRNQGRRRACKECRRAACRAWRARQSQKTTALTLASS